MDSLALLKGVAAGLGALLGACVLALVGARRRLREAHADLERRHADAAESVRETIRERERALETRAREAEVRREADHRERLERFEIRVRHLDDRLAAIGRREADLGVEAEALARDRAEVERDREAARARRASAEAAADEARARLEEIAGTTREAAREALIEEVADAARRDAARLAGSILEEARRGAEDRARDAVVRAIESTPGRVAAEATVTLLRLPSDEMKGRIIGREGRNIRAVETATGVDLVVDDTPSAILLSSFDPARRELALRTLQTLIDDGRIHPARIEDVVERSRREMAEAAEAAGEGVAFELALTDVHPRLLRLVGRLRHRSLEGQGLLDHCRETAWLAGHIGSIVGVEAEPLRRAGLLHEVARGDDPPVAESAAASADLAAKYGEAPVVVEAIRSLAPGARVRPPAGAVLFAAKRISVSRPGARSHNRSIQIQRLLAVEEVALSFPAVREAVAVKAGRELRVLLREDASTDEEVTLLAGEIARRVQEEVDFPGQVKVSVIRETRAIEYAL